MPGRLVVTGRAVRREPGVHVVRVRGRVVVGEVTGITVGRCSSEPIAVALQTVHVRVRAGERERRGVMIEGGVVLGTLIAAHRAVRGEPGSHMVRISCLIAFGGGDGTLSGVTR